MATAAKGIAEVITHHYSTNIDLRDAKTVLADSGTAIMGSAQAHGEEKAKKAIELALDSPLLNDNKISGAKNVLLLIVSGNDEVTMDEIGTINDYIQIEAGHNANIIMGIGEDENLGDNISVTVIATGFPVDQQDFNGKEEQPIVHTLDEEPSDNTFSVSKTKSSTSNKITETKTDSIPEEKRAPEIQEPLLDKEEDIEDEFLDFTLRVDENVPSSSTEEDYSFSSNQPEKQNKPTQDSSNISQSNDFASERKDTQAQSKGNNYNLFTLDEAVSYTH